MMKQSRRGRDKNPLLHRMRRLLPPLLALLVLCGCAGPKESTVRPLPLNQEQQGILDLLGQRHGVLLFEYEVFEPYTLFEVWVEIYHNGDLVEPHAAGLAQSEPAGKPRSGNLAITISETPDFVWEITAQERTEHGEISSSAFNSVPYPHPGTAVRAFSALEDAAAVADGAEIILYAGVFTDAESSVIYNAEEYARDPDRIARAEHLHLIKCRFSNGEAPQFQ